MAEMGNVRGVQVWRGRRLGGEASATFLPARTGLGSPAMLAMLQGRCRRKEGCCFLLKPEQPALLGLRVSETRGHSS